MENDQGGIGYGESARTSTPDSNNKTNQESMPRVCGPQPIPTLKCELMTLDPDSPSGYSFVPCIPNAREPTNFDLEFFVGKAMLMVRTDPLDDMMKPFFIHPKKVRTFEVQVQGKFKTLPSGEIFVGAESLHKLELGMITRSIAKASMAFAGGMVKDLQYSFGDDPDVNKDYQVPHVTSPMFPTFDKILITRPGETLPTMGVPFDEDLDYRKERLKFVKTGMANIDRDTTFSFSVNTCNIDLENWKLCGIPMVRPMDLRVVLGDSPIQLVAYQIPGEVIQQYGTQVHPSRFLDYVFKLRMMSVDGTEEDMPVNSDVDISEDDGDTSPRAPSISVQELPLQDDNDNEDEDDDDDENDEEIPTRETEDDQMSPTGEEGSSPTPIRKRLFPRNVFGKRRGDRGTSRELGEDYNRESFISDKAQGVSGVAHVRGWIKKRMSVASSNREDGNAENSNDKVGDTLEETAGDYLPTDYDMESTGDLSLCPGCVELNEVKKDQITILKRKVMFILMFTEIADLHHRNSSSGEAPVVHDDLPRIRSYAEISNALKGGYLSPIPKQHKNKRLSTNERRRRQIVESMKNALSQNNPATVAKLYSLLCPLSSVDTTFLVGDAVPTGKHKKGKEESYEGKVVLASSSRHFTEQYLVLTKTEAIFYKGVYSKLAAHRMPITSILSVSAVFTVEIPIPEFSFFKIETHARVYYIAVRCDLQRNDWVQLFMMHVNSAKNPPNSSLSSSASAGLFASLDPLTNRGSSIPLESLSNWSFYLARPTSWRSDSKRVFNYRRIIFTPDAIQDQWRNLTPNALIEGILAKAFELASHSEQGAGMTTSPSQSTSQASLEDYHTELWMEFLDDISLLQTADLRALTDRERVAFFLNLYHVMVLHGCLVIGPPPSWKNWNSFFNNIAYIVSYEMISIAEVEHNILRAKMSRPSSLQFIQIPQSKFPGLAITNRDFRFNFCINSGAKSMPAVVPIYKPESLDDQLDEMTYQMLSRTVEVDYAKKAVTLPKFFLRDFSPAVTGTLDKNKAAHGYLLKAAHYLKKEEKLLLNRLISEYSNINFKYKKPNYRCRLFSKYKSMSEDISRKPSMELDTFLMGSGVSSMDAAGFGSKEVLTVNTRVPSPQVPSSSSVPLREGLSTPVSPGSGAAVSHIASTATQVFVPISPKVRVESCDSTGQRDNETRQPPSPRGSVLESSVDESEGNGNFSPP